MLAYVSFPSEYTSKAVDKALKARLPACEIFTDATELAKARKGQQRKLLQWCDYDELDFDALMQEPSKNLSCSFMIRKALTRKHHLPVTIHQYTAKHPDSTLPNAVPKTFTFELSYPEDLDELWFDELYELDQSFQDHPGQYWLLKAGMADKGQSIRLFQNKEELEAIVQDFADDSSDEETDEQATPESHSDTKVSLSQMRMWVIQKYIEKPLLVSLDNERPNRKFHLRVYVLCVGALQVYVYDQILALFAPGAYVFPPEPQSSAEAESSPAPYDLSTHLTNTCLQDSGMKDNPNVQRLQDLEGKDTSVGRQLSAQDIERIMERICGTIGEVFQAAVSSGSHFQALPNAFEIYGVDFLVDEQDMTPLLLEINGGPDFAQTGERLNDLIGTLFEGTIELAVKPFDQRPVQQPPEEVPATAVLLRHFRNCLSTAVRPSW